MIKFSVNIWWAEVVITIIIIIQLQLIIVQIINKLKGLSEAFSRY